MCFGTDLEVDVDVDEDWWIGPLRDNVDYFHITKFSSLWVRFKNYCSNTVFKWPMERRSPPISYFRRQDYDNEGNFDPLVLNPNHEEDDYGEFNKDRRIMMEKYLRSMALFLEEYQILDGLIQLGRVVQDDGFTDPISQYRQYYPPFSEVGFQTIALNRLLRVLRALDPRVPYEDRLVELSHVTRRREEEEERQVILKSRASTLKSKVAVLERMMERVDTARQIDVQKVEKYLESQGIESRRSGASEKSQGVLLRVFNWFFRPGESRKSGQSGRGSPQSHSNRSSNSGTSPHHGSLRKHPSGALVPKRKRSQSILHGPQSIDDREIRVEIESRFEEVSRRYKNIVAEERRRRRRRRWIRRLLRRFGIGRRKKKRRRRRRKKKKKSVPELEDRVQRPSSLVSLASAEDDSVEELFVAPRPSNYMESPSRSVFSISDDVDSHIRMREGDLDILDQVVDEKNKLLEVKLFKLWMLQKLGEYHKEEKSLRHGMNRSSRELELLRKKEMELKMSLEIEERVQHKFIPPWMKWFVKKRELGLPGVKSLDRFKARLEDGVVDKRISFVLESRNYRGEFEEFNGPPIQRHKQVLALKRGRPEPGVVRLDSLIHRNPQRSPFQFEKSRESSWKSSTSMVVVKKETQPGHYGFAIGSKVVKTIYQRSEVTLPRSHEPSALEEEQPWNEDDDERVLEQVEFLFRWPSSFGRYVAIDFSKEPSDYVAIIVDPGAGAEDWLYDPELDNFLLQIPPNCDDIYTTDEIKRELYRRATIHIVRALKRRMRAVSDILRVLDLNLVWRTSFDSLFHGIFPIFDPYCERNHTYGYIYNERFSFLPKERLLFILKLFSKSDDLGLDGVTFDNFVTILRKAGVRSPKHIIWAHFNIITRSGGASIINFEETLEVVHNLIIGKYENPKHLYPKIQLIQRRMQRLADLDLNILMNEDCF